MTVFKSWFLLLFFLLSPQIPGFVKSSQGRLCWQSSSETDMIPVPCINIDLLEAIPLLDYDCQQRWHLGDFGVLKFGAVVTYMSLV